MNYQHFKAYFYLRSTTKTVRKNDVVAVYFRVQQGNQRKDFSTHIYGPRDFWSNDLKRFNHNGALSKRANRELENFQENVNQVYWKLTKTKGEFDLIEFHQHLTGKHEVPYLVKTFDKRIEELEAMEGKEYASSTITTYRVARKHLQSFLKTRNGNEDIILKQVNKGFVNAFYEYLKTVMGVNSANKNMRKLKAVLTKAVDEELLTTNPAKGVGVKDVVSERVFLTEEEINRVARKEIKIKRLAVVRDMFLFQCFTALAFSDIKELMPEHIIKDNGRLFISKNRRKSKVLADIPLAPEALELLKKYESTHPGGNCFPVPTNQKLNSYLKEIGDICGIQKEITSHVGRHSFAMMMLNRGMDHETLRRIMGLSTTKHIQVYARLLKSTLYDRMTELGPILVP